MDNNRIDECRHLIEFQKEIAQRWIDRGDAINDHYAKFYFYFSGLNAMYFLWSKIDRIQNATDETCIEHLLAKFEENRAKEILKHITKEIEYFRERKPIQKMQSRNCSKLEGNPSFVQGHKDLLLDERRTFCERLLALCKILYIIRCNLVHGSKGRESGDDSEIIKHSVRPLRELLIEAINITDNALY